MQEDMEGVVPNRPVEGGERIASIDVLRGVALLGILLMNIQNFGLPGPAYENPAAWGGATGWNLYYWVANQILFEGKMRFIFSLLFGAGTVLLTERAERRGAGIATADIYLRRCLWMTLMGMLHAYLIWEGDILYFYGTVGLGLFVFRNLRVRQLLIAAGVVFLLVNVSTAAFYFSQISSRDDGIAALKIEEAKRTKEQKKAADSYQETLKGEDAVKRRERIEEHIAVMRGNYLTVLRDRAPHAFASETAFMMKFGILDVLFPMLLGIAFYKSGILTAERSPAFYAKLALAGYALGLPVLAWTTKIAVDSHWDLWTRPLSFLTYEYGRLTIGVAHIALIVFVFRLGWLRPLAYLLAKVGQMALTNYLLTSVLMTLYFNGYGFGRFGALERHSLLFVVLAMWSINLIISPIWLKRFRFGPMEWVWRSLTYWKKQPMRLGTADMGKAGESSQPLPAALS